MSKKEEWRPVPKSYVPYEGYYEVSSWGRVRSLDRKVVNKNGCKQFFKGKMLVLSANNAGYFRIGFCFNSQLKSHLVHRVVLEAFYGECLKGQESRHLDGDPSNNHIDNLVWSTRAENIKDRWRHTEGQYFFQVAATKKLSSQKVMFIRKQVSTPGGISLMELAKRYDVSYPTIWNAAHGKSWALV